MSFAIVVGAGVGLVGTYVASKDAGEARDQQQAQYDDAAGRQVIADQRADEQIKRVDEAIAKLNALTPPNLMQYIQPYQQAVIQGTITPEEAQFKILEDSAAAGVRAPPELVQAQMNALTKIKDISEQGGMTAIDRARLLDIQEQQSARSRGEQEAILQEAQRRGVAGSGTEIANRLISQQASATRASAAGVNVAAEAQKRALEAIQMQGQLAGQMRTSDVAEAQARAAAADAVARYNNSFQNSTAASNVAGRNAAQIANLAERQRISEYNIGAAEREAAARLGAAQTGWQNTINQVTGAANLTAGQAAQANTVAANANNAAGVAAGNLANANANSNATTAAAIQQAGSSIGKLVDAYNRPVSTTTVNTSGFRQDDPYRTPGYFGGSEGE